MTKPRRPTRVRATFATLLVVGSLALGGTALAHPAPEPILPLASCDFPQAIYPVPGQAKVPIDAKIWVLLPSLDSSVELVVRRGTHRESYKRIDHPLGVLELDVGELKALQTYRVFAGSEELTHFTAGIGPSKGVIAAPGIVSAAATSDLPETSNIRLELNNDTLLTETTVRIEDGETLATFIAPAVTLSNMGTQCAGYLIAARRLCFDVRAVDLSGKRSGPTTRCVKAEQGPGMQVYPDRYDPDNDPPYEQRPTTPSSSSWPYLLALLAPFLVGWIVLVMRETAARKPDAEVTVDHEIVRRLAVHQRARAELYLIGSSGALLALELVTSTKLHVALATVPLLAIVVCIGTAQRLHGVIAALDAGEEARRRTRHVMVGRTWLAARERDLESTAAKAMPRARVQ